MSFREFCTELQRRLPVAIAGYTTEEAHAFLSLEEDPAQVVFSCTKPLTLAALVEIETHLAARAVALKTVTVH